MQLSSEQQQIRELVRHYVATEIIPFAAEWDRTHHFPQQALAGLAKLGFYGMCVPSIWGGADIGQIAAALVIEEVAFGDASCSTIISVTNTLVSMSILRYGNEAQKKQFLVPLAQGEKLGAFCLTEPQAGSDAAEIAMKATRVDDHYVLNGVKQFITSGQHADIALVFALTDPAAGKKGISAFIVPTATPGYRVSKVEDKLGQRASDTCQIVFEDCKIPTTYRLGDEGQGYKIALSNLEGGRIGIAAQSVGIARAAFEAAAHYAKERQAFGKPLAEQPVLRAKLADMATQIHAARLMYLHAASLREAKQACLQEAAMAKLFASEMAERVCSEAIQIHGGYGYLCDFPVERYYRDVRVTQIYEGSSEIQRLLIARGILDN